MKKLILFCVVIFFASCMSKTEKKEKKEKASLDSTLAALKAMKDIDSIEKVKESLAFESYAAKIPECISIIKYYTSQPNSACGVDPNIVWKNLSDKVVKYARFTLVPYNAVDDIVTSEIGGESYKRVKDTGPVKPGASSGYGTSWDCLWYNCQIKKMKITEIELEYMDGSTISTKDETIIEEVLQNKKKISNANPVKSKQSVKEPNRIP
jgi:hypothetical protein